MDPLDEIILADLRTSGPWLPEALAGELTWRADKGLIDGVTGLVSVGAVLTVLNRLRAKCRAVETDEGWDYLAPREVVTSGRVKQAELWS